MKVSPKRNAFTLIELLTVVAIVAILASLLSVGYSKSISYSNQLKCVSNLRRINNALMQYAGDHEQTLPYRGSAGWMTPDPVGIWTYIYGDEDIWKHYNASPPFYGTIYACPEAEAKHMSSWGYGMNNCAATDPYYAPIVLSHITHPSQTMVVMETFNNWAAVPPGGDNGPMGLQPRHGRGLNILFFDGHVETMPYDQIPMDPRDVFWSQP